MRDLFRGYLGAERIFRLIIKHNPVYEGGKDAALDGFFYLWREAAVYTEVYEELFFVVGDKGVLYPGLFRAGRNR